MVSFTPVLKRNNAMQNSILIKRTSLLLLLTCLTNISLAKNIDIKSTHTYKENNIYYIDNVFDFKLTDEAHDALLHGIPLEIHTQYQLRLKRKWLWDKTISEKRVVVKLEYMPLTNNFLTVNMNTGLRESYSNLDAALNHINKITRMKLFEGSLLNQNERYIARVKTFLDISSLPTPLRPQAYFLSEWDISSKWLEWEIVQ